MSQRAVELWLQNDAGLYGQLQDAIRDAIDRGDTREDSERILADGIQELVESECDSARGLVADLVQEALEDVDYRSMAEDELAAYGDDEWPVIDSCTECGDDYDVSLSEGADSGLCSRCYSEAEKESSKDS